jgi:hypothetical protein
MLSRKQSRGVIKALSLMLILFSIFAFLGCDLKPNSDPSDLSDCVYYVKSFCYIDSLQFNSNIINEEFVLQSKKMFIEGKEFTKSYDLNGLVYDTSIVFLKDGNIYLSGKKYGIWNLNESKVIEIIPSNPKPCSPEILTGGLSLCFVGKSKFILEHETKDTNRIVTKWTYRKK